MPPLILVHDSEPHSDDRSADRTSEILKQLAKEDSRLKVVRVDVLPEGWLGKCHACHVGALAAKGDWILFTDADCWSKPDVLLRALLVAEREQADHVTLTSGLAVASLGLRAGSLLFHLSLANWFSGVNRDRLKSFLGIGAFNLVRTSAYRQCGGYEALRLTVLDDVKLSLRLRRAGKRTRAFLGVQDVEGALGSPFLGYRPAYGEELLRCLGLSSFTRAGRWWLSIPADLRFSVWAHFGNRLRLGGWVLTVLPRGACRNPRPPHWKVLVARPRRAVRAADFRLGFA